MVSDQCCLRIPVDWSQKNYIYKDSSVSVYYVTELLLNDWTDFDEIFCVCSRRSENGLDSQFCPLDNDNVCLFH
uniref:SFRICE_014827 n=1 Tax=Spodoptera frugiperda TaxID=7108 RepID=A0A2H1V5X8_SPOFR